MIPKGGQNRAPQGNNSQPSWPDAQYGVVAELTQQGVLNNNPAHQHNQQNPGGSRAPPERSARHASGGIHQGFGLNADDGLWRGQPTQPTGPNIGSFNIQPSQPVPYGLVAELTQNGTLNPLTTRTNQGEGPLASNMRRQQAAKRQLVQQLDQAAGPQGNLPLAGGTIDPTLQAAVIAAGAPEPDYGLVAELRNASVGDPLVPHQDFGLAAEVARRRQCPDGKTSIPVLSSAGGSLAARPRKRLAASGPPADFALAQQIAALQAQAERDRLDPFNSANRASNADPFVMAGDLIKFPTAPYVPEQAMDQELPAGPVPLKVPPSGASQTSQVSNDDKEYGLAEELGVDPEEARRRRRMALDAAMQLEEDAMQGPLLGYDEYGQPILGQMPPPDFFETQAAHKYVYDEDTGMLLPPEGMEGEGGKETRQYIEDAATGNFYRLNNPGVFRRMVQKFQRREAKDGDGEPEEGEEGYDPDKGKLRGKLRTTSNRISNTFSTLGIFVQGLLGGFALLNFFMTYLVYSGNDMRDWLMYYANLGLLNNRVYYTLITLSIIASSARLARDQMRTFTPNPNSLKIADWVQLILYIVAYITSILCTPLDDELKYEYGRNPYFYRLTFSSGFKDQLSVWHGLNVIRTICSGIGWLLCCYQNSPFVLEGIIRFEMRQRYARRTVYYVSPAAMSHAAAMKQLQAKSAAAAGQAHSTHTVGAEPLTATLRKRDNNKGGMAAPAPAPNTDGAGRDTDRDTSAPPLTSTGGAGSRPTSGRPPRAEPTAAAQAGGQQGTSQRASASGSGIGSRRVSPTSGAAPVNEPNAPPTQDAVTAL